MILNSKETIQLGANIEAVCIPTTAATYDSSPAWITGFGLTVDGGGSVSRYLMEVAVPLASDSYCVSRWGINTTTQICAGTVGLGKDSCNGDSGGPLVKRGTDGRWHLVGLTSYGGKCGDGGVYTKLSGFTAWMQNVVAKN